MNMIVTADDNWAIGNRGRRLVSIPSDNRFVQEETQGKVVVLGRRALADLPHRQLLPDRTNLVLTSDPTCRIRGAETLPDLAHLLQKLQAFPSEDVYVLGGESTFRQLLPYCDLIHVTKLHHHYQADAWFPNLDELDEWVITGDSEEQTYFDLEYHFFRYERRK